MKRINGLLRLCFIISVFSSCETREVGFFGEMPDFFDGSNLSMYSDIIESLKIKKDQSNDRIEISCKDCDLMPLCGYLMFRNDSVFYSNKSDNRLKLFFALKSKKKSIQRIEYSASRSDRITFLGTVYDPIIKDSVFLLKLTPVTREIPPDGDYLKYISIKNGGIKMITFSSGVGKEVSIELSKAPKIISVH